jgi:thiamine monophosphate synthase
VLSILRMSVHAVTSASHRRIHRAQRWLENRAAAEEMLIIGASLDAANELARRIAKKKGAAFAGIGSHFPSQHSASLRQFWPLAV